jgi:hypothetical protein
MAFLILEHKVGSGCLMQAQKDFLSQNPGYEFTGWAATQPEESQKPEGVPKPVVIFSIATRLKPQVDDDERFSPA